MTCPMCGRPTQQKMRPFCSKRCADLDLARWFNGSYAVPSHDLEDAADLGEALEKAEKDNKGQTPH